MDKTKIDWCESTWNPVTGCLHGCEYCYARSIAHRFGGFTELEDTDLDYEKICESNIVELEKPLKYINGKGKQAKAPYPFYFKPTLYRYKLNEPQKWKKSRNIFVCSMADLFGSWVPDSWIEEVFKACEKAPQHNYIFLTKNPVRYALLQDKGKLIKKPNMWYGNSITNKEQMEIADCETGFLGEKARTFYSIEPLLEDITDSKFWKNSCGKWYMDWVIIGAETGRRKDKVVPERKWIENIVNDCRKEDISVFMKSSLADIWGEPLMQEFPKELRKRGLGVERDLISREEVIKLIDECWYVNCHDSKDFLANGRVDKIRQKVVEIPTAFDLENVIKQFKERVKNYRNLDSGEQIVDVAIKETQRDLDILESAINITNENRRGKDEREILFRGKRTDNGKWAEGYYQQRYDDFENIQHLIFFAKSSTVWEYAEVEHGTVCQYTGLTDKNGRKVFEWDIIRGKTKTPYIVEYCADITGFMARNEVASSGPCMNRGAMESY